MNAEKKLLWARVLLAMALVLGFVSTFLDWELIQPNGCWRGPTSRSFFKVISGILYGAAYEIAFYNVNIPTLRILRILLYFYLLFTLLTPIFLARIFSQSRILYWLWAFVFIGGFLIMIYLHQRHACYVFATYLGGRMLGYDSHISWLSGFYCGCVAVLLHLLGMVMIYFSSPRLNIAQDNYAN